MIFGFTDQFKVGVDAEEGAQSRTDDGVVIHEHDADFVCHVFSYWERLENRDWRLVGRD